jgi:hypothetical protein
MLAIGVAGVTRGVVVATRDAKPTAMRRACNGTQFAFVQVPQCYFLQLYLFHLSSLLLLRKDLGNPGEV